MSETERIRALLDERGVKYKEWDGVHPITVWHDGQFTYEYMERSLVDGVKPHTGEVLDGTGRLEAVIHVCSPEQAIEATLGRGTCKVETTYCDMWKCDECGEVWWQSAAPCYCPSCGRVVES